VSVHDAVISRHANDLIVGECKDGPTQGGGHRRLDYWVLRRSWVNPAMIGYEVKATRGDFLNDHKWRDYLPLCNELWFIQEQRDLIKPEELPQDVGLLRLAGTRLMTVRKAVYREIEPPIGLLTYVLMCRAKIVVEPRNIDNRTEFWKDWLETREWTRELGWNVSKALAEKVGRDVIDVRSENERLRRQNESLSELKVAIERVGIKWRDWMTLKEIEEHINAPTWTRREIERVRDSLTELLNGHADPR